VVRRLIRTLSLLGAIAVVATGCKASVSVETGPRYDKATVVADLTLAEPTDAFIVDAEEVVVVYEAVDLTVGTVLKAVWIAVNAEGVSPDYVIDEATKTIDAAGDFSGYFSLTRPDNGWPPGDYRVDLYIGAEALESLTFTIGVE